MRLAFVVRSLFFQKPSFATIHLALEASRAGHQVWFFPLGALTWTNENSGIADGVQPGEPTNALTYLEPLRQEHPNFEPIALESLDALFLRFNPFHPEFGDDLAHHPLFPIAEGLEQQGVRVLNSPRGLRRAASKGYVLSFPQTLRPQTLVSRNPERLKRFIRELGRPVILKPLTGSGGRNVFYVDGANDVNLNQMLSAVRADSYVLAQEYLPGGLDKRVLLWNGDVLRSGGRPAVFQRVSPEGEFRSNMQLGATRRPCQLSAEETRVVEQVGKRLREDGVAIAGLDLVGEKLLEINVFCPGGIQNCNELYEQNFGAQLIRQLQPTKRGIAPPRELHL